MNEVLATDNVNSSAKAAPQPRWQRRKLIRPGEILDAAHGQFVARGFSTASMDDIARAAGITKGTLYLYFPSKQDLFRAVVLGSIDRTFAEGDELLRTFTGSAEALLAIVVRMWWKAIGETRYSGVPKLMIVESANFPELAKAYEQQFIASGEALIARAIEYGIDRGEFRRVNVNVTVKLIKAPIVMATLWKHSESHGAATFDVDRFLEEVLLTLIRGLANKSPTTEQF